MTTKENYVTKTNKYTVNYNQKKKSNLTSNKMAKTIPSQTSNYLRVGEIYEFNITALGPKGIGIDEFSYGYSILIPNAKLGEKVKAQIIKIHLKKSKYAVAILTTKVLLSINKDNKDSQREATAEYLEETRVDAADESFKRKREGGTEYLDKKIGMSDKTENFLEKINVGDLLTVKINRIAIKKESSCAAAFATHPALPAQFPLILPLNNIASLRTGDSFGKLVGTSVKVQVTRIKKKYGFAKIVSSDLRALLNTFSSATNNSNVAVGKNVGGLLVSFSKAKLKRKELTKGSKVTLTLPKTAKKYAKHLVLKVTKLASQPHNSNSVGGGQSPTFVLFIKSGLGAKFGDKVRVKLTKIHSKFAIGKMVKIAPISALKKQLLIRQNLYEMLTNGMHYGEKVVKCQARMRNYIWNRKKGQNQNRPLIKKGRHLINLLKTRRCLNISLNQLTKYAAKGRTFLFVGTKKPAAGLVALAALLTKTSFFVNTRWLGGMLTNWKTIIKSISKIRPILKEKQKVISNILQKRDKIQNRLIKKVLSLRKKSKVLIQKGKQLIQKVKNDKSINLKTTSINGAVGAAYSAESLRTGTNRSIGEALNIKRKELFERGQLLLQRRQSLIQKHKELKLNTQKIKESGFLMANKYKVLFNRLTTTHKKLHEIRLLFILNKELRNIQKLAKEQGKNKYTISYHSYLKLSGLATKTSGSINNSINLWLVPNPPIDVLNQIIIPRINEISLFSGAKPKVEQPELSGSAKFSNLQSGLEKSFKSQKEKKKSIRVNLTLVDQKKYDFIGQKCNTPCCSNFSTKPKDNTSNSGSLNEIIPSGTQNSVSKLILLTKLCSQFSRFLPYIQNYITILEKNIQGIEKKMDLFKTNLKTIKNKLRYYVELSNQISSELDLIKAKYTSEQQIIRILKRKLKRHESEKRLLQFLPKLRYLPTPKTQISLAIQILMKKFVDAKMKYPMDLIYDEKLRKKSKKVAAARKKKLRRLETYFGGIANMTKLKKTQISQNVLIIIGQQEEMNAVRECQKLGIKMFHIVDTNCNPSLADHFIPANDDSRNSIKYILTKLVTRIRLAQKMRLRFKRNSTFLTK